MTNDQKWFVGTGAAVIVAVVGSTGANIAVMVMLNADLRADVRRLDDRLRAVESALHEVDTRLAAVERIHQSQLSND